MKDNNIIDSLCSILAQEGIEDHLIREVCEERIELYYIKRELDMKRSARLCDISVRVYRRFCEDGEEYRGSCSVIIFPSMTKEQIRAKLRCAHDACLHVKDKAYPHAPALSERIVCATRDPAEVAEKYARALFAADNVEGAFINSAEIFTSRKTTRILTSHGVDVSYDSFETSGELVAESKLSEDVELYDAFRYSGECYEELEKRAAARLAQARERSVAQRLSEGGEFDVILEEEHVRELLGYMLWRSDSKNICTGYSTARVGDEAGGRIPDITASVTIPFSEEGIRMRELPLVRDGRLCAVTGGMRFCSYLGCEPAGVYERITVSCGSKSKDELCSGRCIHIVSFSDFQFDPLDGYFGGEVRLAYLIEDGKRTPLTGFSVSGNYRELCGSFEFSKERACSYSYDGPRYMRISGVCAG